MKETGQLNNCFVLLLMMLMNTRKLNVWKFEKSFFYWILQVFLHDHRKNEKNPISSTVRTKLWKLTKRKMFARNILHVFRKNEVNEEVES
jgi:hypothetical protein